MFSPTPTGPVEPEGAQVLEEATLDRMRSARAALLRGSTAERVADSLRALVMEGALAPGARLPEEALTQSLGVSRNTLREAFRLLGHERLVRHELHRGVFVSTLGPADVTDVFRLRRILECAAVRAAPPPGAVARVRAAVDDGLAAAAVDDWARVATANMHFHQRLAGLAGSARLDETMRHLLAELRLTFHVMPRPQEFHEPYLAWNGELVALLEAGDRAAVERELRRYLDTAERRLLEGYATAQGA